MTEAFMLGFVTLWWASWVFVGACTAIAVVALVVVVIAVAVGVVLERLGITT